MTIRAYLRLFAAALILAVCFIGFSIARLVGRQNAWVPRFLRVIGHLVGLRVTIEGKPAGRDVLYVANHISWLDILAIGGTAPVRFIAKDQIAHWPLVGKLAKLGGTVFVARERRGATREQADTVVTALGEGRPVMLFAEGGTGDGSIVRPFRAALFASAVESGKPVQPVAIDYGPDRMRYAWPPGMSFADEARRMLNRAEPVPVTLRFLPPLDPRMLDRKTLAARSQDAIAGALS
ncbi:1-acyl-sn-glycerol-3-phosphate acyltransferase [Sphingomonas sp. AP4-R1]|uniref:lysophospholipid acyltransferase family protein n=1 Tax=Sphingomonas sp. AP4-R1 TaxID=2735134 RepID=UPI001493CCA2|nr:lysophospholipid acyltransferase family protein [Sphingomonas sp. AP4-R1]QJU56487.1 1-acyl-sn-glycerol-3-phosphate acyltransferase [Sphingomonas sp. AP4-R1]